VNPLFWVVIAALLSGFFSLAAHALRTLRRVQLEEAFHADSSRKRLERLERQLVPLRLTTSFCRSVANIVLVVSMIYLFGLGNRYSPVLATAAAAAVIAVFGVAIPHAWGAHAGEKFLAAALEILTGFRYALYPVILVMQAFDMPVRRLAGAEEQADQGESAKQEILQVATEGQAEGTVEPEEFQMIESIIEFGQTHADKIMTPRTEMFALPVETSLEEACRKIVEQGHTRVPLYQDDLDNIIGILHSKDLLAHLGDEPSVTVRSIMRKPFFVPTTKPLDDLLREFKAGKVHMAVVLDEYGGTAGLVTIEDLLEEIVGEIADEYDRAEPALMHRIDNNTAEVDGRMYIDDLNKAMHLEIPESENYDTIAGFVFSELGYIPSAGEKLQGNGARITVLAADARRITRLRVERLAEDNKAEKL